MGVEAVIPVLAAACFRPDVERHKGRVCARQGLVILKERGPPLIAAGCIVQALDQVVKARGMGVELSG